MSSSPPSPSAWASTAPTSASSSTPRMPKCIEHYQQETGRAGRDGLPAECLLLYSGSDPIRWRQLIEQSPPRRTTLTNSSAPRPSSSTACTASAPALPAATSCSPSTSGRRTRRPLRPMKAVGEVHPTQSRLPREAEVAHACDVCLGDLEPVPDSATIAKKILSCIARTNQSFGMPTSSTSSAALNPQKILDRRHNELTTFGLLRGTPKALLAGYIGQLLDQKLIEKSPGEYPVLVLTPAAVEVMRDQREVQLLQPRGRPEPADRSARRMQRQTNPSPPKNPGSSTPSAPSGVQIARERNVPPYVVFHDTALREMARRRPTTLPQPRPYPRHRRTQTRRPRPAFYAVHRRPLRERQPRSQRHPCTRGHASTSAASRPKGEASRAPHAYFALFDRGLTLEEAAKETVPHPLHPQRLPRRIHQRPTPRLHRDLGR